MDFVLTLCLVAGVRVAIRLYLLRDTAFIHSFFRKQGRPAKKMLLIGAGAAGEQILHELIGNQHLRAEAVGLLDDNAEKVGKSIHGVPVLGTVDGIEEIDVDFDEILIACPSATGAQMKRIVAACERTGKPFKTMPPLGEVIDGRVSMKMVREVSVTDVVGREEVRLEEDEIKKYLLGKRVLVTGAGGSIGSELVRQIARFRPGRWPWRTWASTTSTRWKWSAGIASGAPRSRPIWWTWATCGRRGGCLRSSGPTSFSTRPRTSTCPCRS
jgi:FlaA1/EpsC-like NDP-sugar epimerase